MRPHISSGCMNPSLTHVPLMQTTDTNSTYMAKFCFALGISLKRVEVISDDEEEIIEATRRMSKNYDFVVTSGGIGPTSVMSRDYNRTETF